MTLFTEAAHDGIRQTGDASFLVAVQPHHRRRNYVPEKRVPSNVVEVAAIMD